MGPANKMWGNGGAKRVRFGDHEIESLVGGAGKAKGVVAWREERSWAQGGPERGVRTVPKGRKQFAMRCGAWERSLDFRPNVEHSLAVEGHRKDQSPGEEL